MREFTTQEVAAAEAQVTQREIDKAYAYHKPSESGLERITDLRVGFSHLRRVVELLCENSRERSIALSRLEEAAMWAIKSVVFNDPDSMVSL